MKVVILCGGQGTRLREETEFRPKPMVNIGPRPILWHIMKRYAHYGYNDFVLCLGYKGEMIKEYFYHYELFNNDFTLELGNSHAFKMHNAHSEQGWKITMVDTGVTALKGARIKRIEDYLDADLFMLTYGDGIADIDVKELVAFHQSHGKMVTVTGVNRSSRFGELKTRGDTVLTFMEKPREPKGLISGGFFVMNKDVLNYLSCDDQCDLEYGPLEKIAGKGELMVYRHPGNWACMDTLRDMEYLNGLWNRNEAFWRVW